MTIGVILVLITVLSITIIVVLHKFIYKYMHSYWVYSVIATLYLIYFIAIRYSADLIEYMNVKDW